MSRGRVSERCRWTLNLLAAWLLVGCLNLQPPMSARPSAAPSPVAPAPRQPDLEAAPDAPQTPENQATEQIDDSERHPSQWRIKRPRRFV
jgi:hypothetical protein